MNPALLVLVIALIVPNPPEAAPTPDASPAAVTPLASPAAKPVPSATPKEQLKEIGRVKAVTSFCKAFVTHFNTSAQLMVSNDGQISFVDFILGKLKKDFEASDRESRLYDDRVNLIAYVKRLQEQMPKLQEAINQLRRSAELTSDADQAKEAREVAAQLQKSLDKEKQITTDTLGVIHTMIDQATHASTAPTSLAYPVELGVFTPATSSADLPSRNPANADDIRSYLEMDRQRDRIGDAESDAMVHADLIGC
jgi:TolA-binding protein